jgi:hypothetical protein
VVKNAYLVPLRYAASYDQRFANTGRSASSTAFPRSAWERENRAVVRTFVVKNAFSLIWIILKLGNRKTGFSVLRIAPSQRPGAECSGLN